MEESCLETEILVRSDNGTGYYNFMVNYIAGNISANAIAQGGATAAYWISQGDASLVSTGCWGTKCVLLAHCHTTFYNII